MSAVEKFLLITEESGERRSLVEGLEQYGPTTLATLDQARKLSLQNFEAILLDLPLGDPVILHDVDALLRSSDALKRTLALVGNDNYHERFQARGLGLATTMARSLLPGRIVFEALKIVDQFSDERSPDHVAPRQAASAISTALDEMQSAANRERTLERDLIDECGALVIKSVKTNEIQNCLEETKNHHSPTYRHSMLVTLFAAVFATRYSLRKTEMQVLTVGALLHDIGKARVPLAILDKTTPLSSQEFAAIRLHPGYGAQMLIENGCFGDDIIHLVRHHHEKFDGTGYPDGLKGSELSQLVRILTVVDIYSALIERRAYKQSFTREKAYQMLVDMGPQLDQEIVRMFAPVAMASKQNRVIRHIAGETAS